ncbi:unnamed protein product, partial [Symbiodinium sp. KB8]
AEARSEPGRGQELTPAKPRAELLGPSLHPREAARSLDHRPKDAQGQYLCWDHLCHRGCNKGSACPHSHKSVPKWSGLDYSVQLQLLRRGGLKGSKAKTAADVYPHTGRTGRQGLCRQAGRYRHCPCCCKGQGPQRCGQQGRLPGRRTS